MPPEGNSEIITKGGLAFDSSSLQNSVDSSALQYSVVDETTEFFGGTVDVNVRA